MTVSPGATAVAWWVGERGADSGALVQRGISDILGGGVLGLVQVLGEGRRDDLHLAAAGESSVILMAPPVYPQ